MYKIHMKLLIIMLLQKNRSVKKKKEQGLSDKESNPRGYYFFSYTKALNKPCFDSHFML